MSFIARGLLDEVPQSLELEWGITHAADVVAQLILPRPG